MIGKRSQDLFSKKRRLEATALVLLVLVACHLSGAGGSGSAAAVTPALTANIEPGAGLGPTVDSATIYSVGKRNCNDQGPGSAQIPFCTFATAVGRLQAGNTLLIQPGIYSERLKLHGLSGQTGAPITIRGTSLTSTVLDGGCPDFPCSIENVDQSEWGELI